MQKVLIILITILFTATFASADVQELDGQPKGARLYQQHCARCHGMLDETRIPDRRPSRITSAIKNLGVMANLKHLNALQIVEISKVLKSDPES
jgi:mono/diheme cytochrome c family protein